MKIIIGLLIFCLVLFIYLHIQFHLKTSDDNEMYEVDNPSKSRLEEICDLRQPVLFDFDCNKIVASTNKAYIAHNYPAFDIKIRNINEADINAELYVPLPLHTAVKLFDEDKNATFFTENNADFLQESGVIRNFKHNDDLLRPYMVSNCYYDILLGSPKVFTPFKYEINYRNFFLLTQGSAQIKLASPHSIKYLYPEYDYENFEFRSPVNPWSPQQKYAKEFDKIQFIDFTLLPGKTLFLPAYWWYSIKFNDSNTSISCFKYRTYMNNVAISPYIALHTLQLQNIKRNAFKKVSSNNDDKNLPNNGGIHLEEKSNEQNVLNEGINNTAEANISMEEANANISMEEANIIIKEGTSINDLPNTK
jgi:hypothetical protein